MSAFGDYNCQQNELIQYLRIAHWKNLLEKYWVWKFYKKKFIDLALHTFIFIFIPPSPPSKW